MKLFSGLEYGRLVDLYSLYFQLKKKRRYFQILLTQKEEEEEATIGMVLELPVSKYIAWLKKTKKTKKTLPIQIEQYFSL